MERYALHNVPEISSSEASRLAVLDSYAYAVSLRDQLMKTCRLSLPAFNTVFENGAYIMDFWNNEVGRSYGKIFPADSWIVFFPSIWNSGELIKHEGQEEITIARRIKLFQSDWWYIN